MPYKDPAKILAYQKEYRKTYVRPVTEDQKAAKAAYNKEYHEANKEKMQAYRKAYYAKRHKEDTVYRERVTKQSKEWHENNRDRAAQLRRANHLKITYGITVEEYEAMSITQGGVCGICLATCPVHDVLCVDHDHATGKVRGLLCNNCNGALGLLQDDADLLLRASEYLKKAALI